MSPALTLSNSENQIGHSIYSFWHFLTFFLFLFQETYPSTPPVWFSESDNVNVTNALTSLSETSGINNHLSYQVKSLLRQLCTLFSLPLPVECTDSDSNSSGCSTGKKSYLSSLKFGKNLVLIILKVWGEICSSLLHRLNRFALYFPSHYLLSTQFQTVPNPKSPKLSSKSQLSFSKISLIHGLQY